MVVKWIFDVDSKMKSSTSFNYLWRDNKDMMKMWFEVYEQMKMMKIHIHTQMKKWQLDSVVLIQIELQNYFQRSKCDYFETSEQRRCTVVS